MDIGKLYTPGVIEPIKNFKLYYQTSRTCVLKSIELVNMTLFMTVAKPDL